MNDYSAVKLMSRLFDAPPVEGFTPPVSPAQRPVEAIDRTMRRVAATLHLVGAGAAVLYGVADQQGVGFWVYLGAAAVLVVLGLTVAFSPPRRDVAGASGFAAIVVITALLTQPDPSIAVPLFYLWPLTAMGYFLSSRVAAAALAWTGLNLAPVLVLGATVEQQVVYVGTLSTVGLMAGLVVTMRRDQAQLHDQLTIASLTDPLTGLLNRRAFEPAFVEMLAAGDAAGADVGAVLFDLDHFKAFNDAHGHLSGDAALRRVSAALRAEAADGELVCRLGGEEFAIAVPGGAPRALAFAGGVARRLGAEPVAAELRLTGSFGIAVSSTAGETRDGERVHAILGRADDALYAAKRGGRARAAFWTEGGIEVGEASEPAELLWIVDDPRVPTVGDPASASQGSEAPDPSGVSAAVRADGRSAWPEAAPLPELPTVDALREQHANRDRLIKSTVAVMFLAGAANSVVGSAMLDIPPVAQRWQWALAAILLVCGLVATRLPGSLRMAQVASVIGSAMVAAVVATCIPLISAPMFMVWPMVVGAYFCSPRFVAWSMAWVAAALAVGLAISPSEIVKPLTYIGTLSNVAMMAALVSMMRWREAQLRRGLQHSAEVDPLTGLLNRRAFNPDLETLLEDATHDGSSVSVVLFDADHFKRFNDQHGHLAGDDALQRIARELLAAAPPKALVCRFGGEEFAVALPGASVPQARAFADAVALGLRADHQTQVAAGRPSRR